VRIATGEDCTACVVLVQQAAPWHVDAFELDPDDLDAMDSETDRLLAAFARAVEDGYWPALDDTGPKMLTMPAYWRDQYERPVRLTRGGEPISFGEPILESGKTDEQIIF